VDEFVLVHRPSRYDVVNPRGEQTVADNSGDDASVFNAGDSVPLVI